MRPGPEVSKEPLFFFPSQLTGSHRFREQRSQGSASRMAPLATPGWEMGTREEKPATPNCPTLTVFPKT